MKNIATRFFMGSSKKCGRPELTAGKRSKKIDARFTEEEYQLILGLEKELGMSKTDLVRMRVLNNAHQVVVNARELLLHLDAVGGELGRVGNNINQLAKHANVLNLKGALSPAVAGHLMELLEIYIANQKILEISLRKIMRAMA